MFMLRKRLNIFDWLNFSLQEIVVIKKIELGSIVVVVLMFRKIGVIDNVVIFHLMLGLWSSGNSWNSDNSDGSFSNIWIRLVFSISQRFEVHILLTDANLAERIIFSTLFVFFSLVGSASNRVVLNDNTG